MQFDVITQAHGSQASYRGGGGGERRGYKSMSRITNTILSPSIPNPQYKKYLNGRLTLIIPSHPSRCKSWNDYQRRPTYRYTVKGEGVTGCYSFAVIGHRPKGLKIFEGWTSVSPTSARGVRILGRLGTCSSWKF